MWIEIAPPLIAVMLVPLGLALLRNRSDNAFEAIAGAVERLRDGEQGVRLEPVAFGPDARLVSRFNAAVAALENKEPMSETVAQDLRLFDILRDPKLKFDSASSGATFVAVLEPDRFAQLRESIGYNLANALMAKLAARLAITLPSAHIGRVGRTTIEFAFGAADTRAATRCARGVRARSGAARRGRRVAVRPLGQVRLHRRRRQLDPRRAGGSGGRGPAGGKGTAHDRAIRRPRYPDAEQHDGGRTHAPAARGDGAGRTLSRIPA